MNRHYRWITETTTYDEPVTATTFRMNKCPACGKKATRQRTFHMIVSPFNKNSDGTVRTRQEVLKIVQQRAKEWRDASPAYHRACESDDA